MDGGKYLTMLGMLTSFVDRVIKYGKKREREPFISSTNEVRVAPSSIHNTSLLSISNVCPT